MKEEYLNVRLERKDVINLIRSTYPPYEDIEMLEMGINPFQDEMEEELKNGDVEYDFAAVNQDRGITIKEWD